MRLEQFARRQAEVLETIRELDRPVSVFEIAQHRGEPPTTVGNLVNALARRGAIVVVYVEPPRRGGRPGRFWAPKGWEPRPPKGDWRDDWHPRPDQAAAWMFTDPHAPTGFWHGA